MHLSASQAYVLRRLAIVMRAEPGNALEAGGVLNPGGARSKNGDFLLFPRLVAPGNYSRIGIAQVQYDRSGIPVGVERQGIALAPTEPYEKNLRSGGGCEDARVTYIAALGIYVMVYVAYSSSGPRAALAISKDLYEWKRVGLIKLTPHHDSDMTQYGNKDAMLFPEPITGPDGRLSLVLMHRPMFEVWVGNTLERPQPAPLPPYVVRDFWTVWLSYCPLDEADWASPSANGAVHAPTFSHHHELLLPEQPWESIRIGGGTPPVRLPEGWFTIYHGIGPGSRVGLHPGFRYVSAALVLDAADPRRIVYRSPEPTLVPDLPEEISGVVRDVVFPTALDRRDNCLDVYYGMADTCIGAARIDLNGSLGDPSTNRQIAWVPTVL